MKQQKNWNLYGAMKDLKLHKQSQEKERNWGITSLDSNVTQIRYKNKNHTWFCYINRNMNQWNRIENSEIISHTHQHSQ